MVSYAEFFQNDLRREVEQIRREQSGATPAAIQS